MVKTLLIRYATPLAAAALAALAIAVLTQTVRLSAARDALDIARLKVEALAATVKAKDALIVAQNAGMQALKIETARRESASAAAAAMAKKEMAKAQDRQKAIAAAHVENTAEDAIRFLVEAGRSAE